MRIRIVGAILLLTATTSFAGGPMLVGSPSFGNDGQMMTWDPARMPITFTVDPGPLSTILDNTAGKAKVQSFFDVWHAAPDAALSFASGGAIKAHGAYTGGDVKTAAQFNAIEASCGDAEQNPVVFDADGTLFEDLGLDSDVIGFAGPCALDMQGHIAAAHAALNGRFQDGVNTRTNPELPSELFDGAFIHEFGHFLGLDHSQINVECLDSCTGDALAGLPTMFPIAIPDSGMNTLGTDDLAWISKLYPKTSFNTSYGKLSGTVFFSDGITPVQGVNVIARRINDPLTTVNESRIYAVSVVSGYRFTSNPGQTLTEHYLPCVAASVNCPTGWASNNAGGSEFGSRSPALYGYYEMALPPGTYTIEVESVEPAFTDGSSVGPLSPPVPMPGGVKEFWDAGESATDNPNASSPITVPAGGEVKNINIILNNTAPRMDPYETGWLLYPVPQAPGRECEVWG